LADPAAGKVIDFITYNSLNVISICFTNIYYTECNHILCK
jgi:hypothetical protein